MLNFKNDKERNAFLEDYRNIANGWYLWMEMEVIGRRFWRYDLPDCALIVEEDQATYHWPTTYVGWTTRNWFIVRDWSFEKHTFRDQAGSKTQALMEIKRIQREQKKRES